jgi:excisionase family DNA binding protein
MKLLTIKELSEFLTIKVSTLYTWVHNGTIPYIKLNGLLRFDMDEIKEWIKRSKSTLRNRKANTKRSFKPSNVPNVDNIVRKSIDNVTNARYNAPIGKPGPSRGSTKEII